MTGGEPPVDREPKRCAACGTVNPWMNERCRSCDAELAAQAPGEEPGVGDGAGGAAPVRAAAPAEAPAGRRIAIRWVVGGAGLFLMAYTVLQLGLMGLIAADDNPALAPLKAEIDRTLGRERVGQQASLESLDEEQKARVRDALLENTPFVLGIFAMLLLPPFFGGLLVGRFSGSLLEAAVACGAGAFIGGALIEGDIWIGLVFLAVMAPLGLPAAVLGRWLRTRHRAGGPA